MTPIARPRPLYPFLYSGDGRVHEVGKENCKQEGDQSSPGNVQKAECQREQQNCKQDSSRTCVNQGH